MVAMVELPAVAAALRSLLVPAAVGTAFAGKVYRGSLAPQGVAPPYALYFLQSGNDDYCLPGDWAGLQAVYFVKGVTPAASYQSALLPGLAALHGALAAAIQTPIVAGGYSYTVLGSDDAREFDEVLSGGQVLVHCGRAWTLAVEAA
jgi:hypothetical protein